MENFYDWLHQETLHQKHAKWLLFLLLLIGSFLLRKTVSLFLSKQLFRLVKQKYRDVRIGEFTILLREPIAWLFMLCMVYCAFEQLTIPVEWRLTPPVRFGFLMIVERLYESALIITISWVFIRFIRFIGVIFIKRAELTDSKIDDQLVPFFRDLGIVVVVILAVFAVLDKIFSVDLAAIITGLGIGGLALALAARENLENLFASFTLFLDMPFVIGDVVQVGANTGEIEKVGFRSTRLRTPDGSQITIPNRLMTSQGLENLSQREFRRVRYLLRITYDTPPERLQAVIEQIKHLIDTHPMTKTREGLVKLDGFGENSFEIQVIFHIETADWRVFQNIKDEINFKVLDIIKHNEAVFALPSRTLYMPKE